MKFQRKEGSKIEHTKALCSLFSLKGKQILTHAATWMNLEGIMLTKISQSQKDKSYMIPLI